MGLRMGEVRLEKSNKEWKGSFEIEKENLGKIFKGIAERVRQLRDQALRRIRKYNSKEFLQDKKEAFLAAINK